MTDGKCGSPRGSVSVFSRPSGQFSLCGTGLPFFAYDWKEAVRMAIIKAKEKNQAVISTKMQLVKKRHINRKKRNIL